MFFFGCRKNLDLCTVALDAAQPTRPLTNVSLLFIPDRTVHVLPQDRSWPTQTRFFAWTSSGPILGMSHKYHIILTLAKSSSTSPWARSYALLRQCSYLMTMAMTMTMTNMNCLCVRGKDVINITQGACSLGIQCGVETGERCVR